MKGYMKKGSKLLVTGGCGFIGSEFTRRALACGYSVAVVDKLTYAADPERLKSIKARYRFYRTDISSSREIEQVFKRERPQFVFHFAAETHVDRSIADPSSFIRTNVSGTQSLLDAARIYPVKKFIHISTDEVYGDTVKGKFNESSSLRPSSPYSASKAAAELLAAAYIRTYGLPVVIVRPSNNYGPWQYPEKFIPVVIHKGLENKKVPVYARGLNVREWLHVSDCAEAILCVARKAKKGEVYNIGSGHEEKNIELARKILDILGAPLGLIEFVADRLGHDLRYSLDSSRVRSLGWRPRVSFEEGLRETVSWYCLNQRWTEKSLKKLSR